MDRAELRARQAPLKQQYRDDPAAALTRVGARADFREDPVSCTVTSWSGPVRAGLHPATGGDGSEACSADMLLQALLACAGVTFRAVALSMGVEVRSAFWEAGAQFDARGTLALDREVPVGLTGIHITARLETDASDDDLARLGHATERYCVVAHSLSSPPTFEFVRVQA